MITELGMFANVSCSDVDGREQWVSVSASEKDVSSFHTGFTDWKWWRDMNIEKNSGCYEAQADQAFVLTNWAVKIVPDKGQ